MGVEIECVWLGIVLGGLPMVGWVLWWWNEWWYAVPLKARGGGTNCKLPPGHMGFPFLGEMITFLWYFKFLRRPDDFINAKRRKLKWTNYLRPNIKRVNFTREEEDTIIQLHDKLGNRSRVLVLTLQGMQTKFEGAEMIVAVKMVIICAPDSELRKKSFAVLKGGWRTYVTNAINNPDALRRLAHLVQPRIVEALQSWALKGQITARLETKKVTFENIGKLFASFEPGPLLQEMDKFFEGLLLGVRAYPFNFPGSAFHHALQCRKKLEAIFQIELEKKKNKNELETVDLTDGLMQMKDEEGNRLSDREVIDNIASLVVAGYESTSTASMWAIYYLSKFPKVLVKLREENMAMKKTKTGDFLTSEDVSKLRYTNKVVEETIRMANIAAFIFRRIINETDYKGFKFPKGWKEPAKPGTYQVFGGGSRICAGNMLARMQIALLFHHLSVGYKWELISPETDMVYLPHPTPIDGVEVSFSKFRKGETQGTGHTTEEVYQNATHKSIASAERFGHTIVHHNDTKPPIVSLTAPSSHNGTFSGWTAFPQFKHQRLKSWYHFCVVGFSVYFVITLPNPTLPTRIITFLFHSLTLSHKGCECSACI
ncbi:hypothetical protein RIF29_08025 [Crotalaria pallida]|uniref:HTH myb-type domain-containing protein n=1 Tax=Crotalaria pallida TaxID=3830 RepID=A0AAN9PB38_CROPI